jgi:hypothetical protein
MSKLVTRVKHGARSAIMLVCIAGNSAGSFLPARVDLPR